VAASGDDTYQRLKTEVESFAAEVSQIRSALTQPMQLKLDTSRPAFRLNRARAPQPVKSLAVAPPLSEIAADVPARVRQDDDDRVRLEAELEFAREQLLARNAEALAAARLAEEKSEQLEEVARALGRARIELDETAQQLRAKEWAVLQIQNENALMRGDGSGHLLPNTMPVEDYDALVESHMSLRAEVSHLQERVVQRDHEVLSLNAQLMTAQQELTVWEGVAPVNSTGLARLAGVLAERSAALEHYEEGAIGQKFLVGALRQELDAVRTALDRRDIDHDRLAQALRMELDCLRAIASEREFVIGHQAHTIESAALRESELSAELAEVREHCESLRRRSDQAEGEREILGREAQQMRAKLAERETEVWRLRATPEAPPAEVSAPGLAQLQSALAARDSELERARERIEFLRSLTREAPPVTVGLGSAPAAPANPLRAVRSGMVTPMVEPDTNVDVFQMNSALQREVERALSTRFPWPLFAILGAMAGLGLLSIGVMVLLLM
jgi:nucleoprotein TPR